jgi:hypothetical protein
LAGAFDLRFTVINRAPAITAFGTSSIFSTSDGMSAVRFGPQCFGVARTAAALDTDLGKSSGLQHSGDGRVRRQSTRAA